MKLRKDVYVYNESTGLVVTCTGLGGRKPFEAQSAEWKRAVADGLILAVELAQDDSIVVRVVVDDNLTKQESAEWVDQLTAKLHLPAAGLAICGGIDYVEDPTSDYAAGFVQHVDVPAGLYRADLYTYFTSPNFPHEDGRWPKPPELDDGLYVDFLLHLTPLGKQQIAARADKQGWVAWKPSVRKLRTAPRGIVATSLQGWTPASNESPPEHVGYARDVQEVVQHIPVQPVTGGEVSWPLNDLVTVFRLVWACSQTALPEIRITPCPSAPPDVTGTSTSSIDGGRKISFDASRPTFARDWMAEFHPWLASLKDGTTIELDTASLDKEGKDDPSPPGWHRYKGPVRGGRWRITHAAPVASAEHLRDALALIDGVFHHGRVDCHSKKELAAIVQGLKEAFVSEKHYSCKGLQLTLTTREPAIETDLCFNAFRVRFGLLWPAEEL